MVSSLFEFFSQTRFESSECQRLWSLIKDRKSFDEKCLASLKPFIKDKSSLSYLPIEFMKEDQSFFVNKELIERPERLFLSSGTTKNSRARSYFSKDGLLLYQLESLKTFYDLLSHFFNEKELFSVTGVSLVPTVKEWPTSSLAQMLSWIAKYFKVDFLEAKTFSNKNYSKPIWVFATALQFKDLIEQNKKIFLPKGSLIIETGGLKSSKEIFSRQDLFSGLKEIFDVPEDRIISEYGMCELSAQAYDFVCEKSSGKMRSYKFPFWVDVKASQINDLALEEGQGCLRVYDPLRVDYPFPIRTQDIIDLKKSGSFSLLGRVPHSVLKGCSLLAEELLSKKKLKIELKSKEKKLLKTCFQGDGIKVTALLDEKKIHRVYDFLKSFFARERTKSSLLKEFSSLKIVDYAISDLLSKFPKDLNSWQEIGKKYKNCNDKKYLLVLPNSHVFALFHPCVVAYFFGIRLSVRLSRAYSENSIAGEFLKEFSSCFSYSIDIIGPNKRIPFDLKTEDYNGLTVFGSDETFNLLRSHIQCPGVFFGSTLSVSIISDFSEETLSNLIKDSFSLAQKGCFSSRLTFCLFDSSVFEKKKDLIFLKVRQVLESSFGLTLPFESSLALDHERVSFIRKEASLAFEWPSKGPLILFYKGSPVISIEDYLSACQFLLPIIFVPTVESIKNALLNLNGIVRVSLSSRLKKDFLDLSYKDNIELSEPGCLNTTIWDGFHQGKSFF